MLERIVAIPDAIVAIPRIPFPDSADTIFAIALPELMAISAKANILLAIANPLSDSPNLFCESYKAICHLFHCFIFSLFYFNLLIAQFFFGFQISIL